MSDNREMIVLNGEQIDELVRCKDCKWYSHFRSITGSLLPEGRCGYHTIYPAPDDYCSRGERKEVEE